MVVAFILPGQCHASMSHSLKQTVCAPGCLGSQAICFSGETQIEVFHGRKGLPHAVCRTSSDRLGPCSCSVRPKPALAAIPCQQGCAVIHTMHPMGHPSHSMIHIACWIQTCNPGSFGDGFSPSAHGESHEQWSWHLEQRSLLAAAAQHCAGRDQPLHDTRSREPAARLSV